MVKDDNIWYVTNACSIKNHENSSCIPMLVAETMDSWGEILFNFGYVNKDING